MSDEANSPIGISVLIASYNEAAVLEKNVAQVISTLQSRPDITWEVILVNDGSNDETGDIINRISGKNSQILACHHERNLGQGRAFRTAFAKARGDFVVTLDADLSYRAEYIWHLIDELEDTGADIVIASPYLRSGEVRNVPFHRRFFSRWGNRYLSWMAADKITAVTSAVRAYRREVLDELFLTADGMELQLEIMMKASICGFSVAEIPAALVWAVEKGQANKSAPHSRRSKMRLVRTIGAYLKMGWLFRPGGALMACSLLFILPACHIWAWLLWHVASGIVDRVGDGESFNWALSHSLSLVFDTYTYSVAFGGGLLVLGLQILFFSLVTYQNQYYFEQNFLLGQHLNRTLTRQEKSYYHGK